MKRYDEYIETGYKFLPQLPSGWDLKLGRSCFEENKKKNSDLQERLLLQFKYGTIIRKASQEIKKDDETVLAKYTVVEPNDIMLNGLNLNYDFVSQRVGIVEEKGTITSAYLALRCRDLYNPFYANYMLKALDSQKIFHGMGSGVRLTLGYPEFSRIQFPVPSCDEQDQIVRYLDWQVYKINHLIHGYQKQIKLLDERKRTQINRVLVSSLNPNVNTTQSKALWMEETPCHWTQYRVKDIMYEVNERSKEGKEPHLSMSQKHGLVTDDVDVERRLLSESYVGAKVCKKDDLVLNRLKAHLGVFALAPHLGVVSPDYTVLRLRQDRVIPKYAEYLLKCNDCRKELVIRVRGIVEGFWRLYTQDLYSIYICIPDIKEQGEILEYIGQLEEKYQVVKDKLQKEVLLLKEYRTRLIADVVTGQIDVRDVVIPEYTPEEDTEIDTDDIGENAEEVAEDAE